MQSLSETPYDQMVFHHKTSSKNAVVIYFSNGVAKEKFVPKFEGVTPAVECSGIKIPDNDEQKNPVHYCYLNFHQLGNESTLGITQTDTVQNINNVRNKIIDIIFEKQQDIFQGANKKVPHMTREVIEDKCKHMWSDMKEGNINVKIPFAYDRQRNCTIPTEYGSLKGHSLVYDKTGTESFAVEANPNNIKEVVPRCVAKFILRLGWVSYTYLTQRFNFAWQVQQILILKKLPYESDDKRIKAETHEEEEYNDNGNVPVTQTGMFPDAEDDIGEEEEEDEKVPSDDSN